MFAAIPIFISLIVSFGAIFACTTLMERHKPSAARTAAIVGVVASLYCVAAGVFLLVGWQDPFASSDPALYGKAAAQNGGRGGLILLIIRFWPYVLIALGLYHANSYRPFVRASSAGVRG